MSALDDTLACAARHAPAWLLGVTLLLGLGLLAASVLRGADRRQRVAELAVGAALVWSALALVPLPRPLAALGAAGSHQVATLPPAAARPADALPAALPAAPPTLTVAGQPPRNAAPRAAPTRNAGALTAGTPARPAATHSANPWEWAVVGYALGAALLLARLAGGALALRRLLRGSATPPDWLAAEVDAARADDPRLRRVRVRIVKGRLRAFCVGVLRPVVVLPASLCRPERRHLLLPVLWHELAHARRRDPRGRAILALAQPLLWPHPFFWWLRRRAEFHSELVADGWAAPRFGTTAYVRALVGLCELRGAQPAPGLGVASIHGPRSQFFNRMNMLLHRDTTSLPTCSRRERGVHLSCAALLVAGLAAGLGIAPAVAAQDPGSARQQAVEPATQAEVAHLRAQVAELNARIAALLAGRTADPARRSVNQHQAPRADAAEPEPVSAVETQPSRGGPAAGRRSSDTIARPALLDLVTRAIEARGELFEIAHTESDVIQQRVAAGVAPQGEDRLAAIRARVAERKLRVLSTLVDAELRATETELKSADAELERLKLLLESGYITEHHVLAAEVQRARTQARLEVLSQAR